MTRITTGPCLAETTMDISINRAHLLRSFQGYSNEIRQFIQESPRWLAPRHEFQQLGPNDRARIREHFAALSNEDIILRFGQSRNAKQLDSYVTGMNFSRDVFVGISQNNALVGFCHMALYDEKGQKTAEIGISLMPETRGKKLASKLMAICFAQAAQLDVADLHIHYLSRNTAMAALCRKFGASLTSESGEVTATLRVHPHKELPCPHVVESGSVSVAEIAEDNSRDPGHWLNPWTWFASEDAEVPVVLG